MPEIDYEKKYKRLINLFFEFMAKVVELDSDTHLEEKLAEIDRTIGLAKFLESDAE